MEYQKCTDVVMANDIGRPAYIIFLVFAYFA